MEDWQADRRQFEQWMLSERGDNRKELERLKEIIPAILEECVTEKQRTYMLHGLDPERDETRTEIKFQKGPRNEEGSIGGVLDVDLLEIVRDRLKDFQSGDFRCRENACALTHIEEALMWMNKRVEDRAERRVLGTYEK